MIDIFRPPAQESSKKGFALIYLGITVVMLFSWLTGILEHDNAVQTAFMFALWLACLAAFFLLTGFEVAYTDLRDKDPVQVNSRLQTLLKELQSSEPKLYEAKEWSSVFFAVAFALIAEWHFEQHAELISGNLGATIVKFRLPLVLAFTTVPILWLAQGPAKRYAIRNSESFLLYWGRITWTFVKPIGSFDEALRFPAPSELIVDFFGIGSKRNLRPSLAAHYMMSLKRFGHGNYRVTEHLRIHRDGTATLDLRCVLCAIDPIGSQGIRGTFKAKGVRPCSVSINSAYQIPQPAEQFMDLAAQLNALGEERMAPVENTFRIEVSSIQDEAQYAIRLPYELVDDDRAFVMDYSVRFELDTGAYALPEEGKDLTDFHVRNFDWPIANCDLRIGLDDDVPGTFANIQADVTFGNSPHRVETARVNSTLEKAGEVKLSLKFPLAGGTYRIKWDIWPPSKP